MSAACSALLQAFNPGHGAELRSCATREWLANRAGERVTLRFDLPSEDARMNAASLVRMADVIAKGICLAALGKWLADVTAWVNEVDGVLTIDALVLDS
jgi:hypothetical protein